MEGAGFFPRVHLAQLSSPVVFQGKIILCIICGVSLPSSQKFAYKSIGPFCQLALFVMPSKVVQSCLWSTITPKYFACPLEVRLTIYVSLSHDCVLRIFILPLSLLIPTILYSNHSALVFKCFRRSKSGKVSRNPFFNFLRDCRANRANASMTITEIARKGGTKWNRMTTEQKAQYYQMAVAARHLAKKRRKKSVWKFR